MPRRNPLARLRNNIRTIEKASVFEARGKEARESRMDLPASIEAARKKRLEISAMSPDHPGIDVQKQYERFDSSIRRGEELRDKNRARTAKRVLSKL